MTNDDDRKAEPPESEDVKNLDGMAKAFIVNVAWSYAEALERSKRAKNKQQSAPESQSQSQVEKADSSTESDP
jgi:hypothetical protein